jgi:hypothetical protein
MQGFDELQHRRVLVDHPVCDIGDQGRRGRTVQRALDPQALGRGKPVTFDRLAQVALHGLEGKDQLAEFVLAA